MKSSTLRTLVAATVFVVLAGGLIAKVGFGTLSGFGWESISVLCPVGALTTMIASRTVLPRALISLGLMIVVVLVFGRVFCGWACPVPLVSRLRSFFRSPQKKEALAASRREDMHAIAQQDRTCSGDRATCGNACATMHAKIDSRHYVLGAALLSSAVFGFPVFCLVCPVGLSFATVLLVWRLFTAGDVGALVAIVPAILVLELVFLRKWCTQFCPIAGLMNIFARFNRTFRPTIDNARCVETSQDSICSRCAEVCDADINLRHLAFGERTLDDCTRCRACVDACPTHAISMPLLAPSFRLEESANEEVNHLH